MFACGVKDFAREPGRSLDLLGGTGILPERWRPFVEQLRTRPFDKLRERDGGTENKSGLAASRSRARRAFAEHDDAACYQQDEGGGIRYGE